MNKYSILKSLSLQDLKEDYSPCSFNTSRALSPNLGISNFAANENIQSSLTSRLLTSSEDVYNLSEVKKLPVLQYRDFSTLLSKLDDITSSKNVQNKDCMLNENDTFECTLKEGSYSYIKIPVKSKPSPLRVLIKQIKGKVLIYLSMLNPRPSLFDYDQVFNTDHFEFKSTDPIFTNNNIYLSIRAIAHSKFTISIYFGKNRVIDRKNLKKNIKTNDEEDEKPFTVGPKKKRKTGKKTTVQNINLRVISPHHITQKNINWSNRHELALRKKKYLLEEKKSKALTYANRQKIRAEQLEVEKLRLEAEATQKTQTLLWIQILFVLKAAYQFNNLRFSKRKEITLKLTKNLKARSLQRAYRRTTMTLSLVQISILRGMKLITFYYKSTKKLIQLNTGKMLTDIIRKAAIRYNPAFKFTDFFHCIIKIQQAYRKYLVVKSERIRKLIILWDQCKAFEVRRSLRKKSMIYQMNVSIYQRQIVLENHYIECMRCIYNEMKEDKPIFVSDNRNDKSRRRRLLFQFMPSVQQMKKMIEQAQSIPDRKQESESSNSISIIK
ncbi:hypothetical protein SteCoe_1257 [Stentor coeruleus]|uniref:Uncharacterized protein n=1 Tax=Stentor coeruleus TaxID=5963 RepID=A0A1R2D2B7_9CILI|nr:hypothetical protein SteCoe_1257 [Stentor coeruleus]